MAVKSANDEDLRVMAFDAIKNATDVQDSLKVFGEFYPVAHTTYHMAQTIAGVLKIDSPYVRTTYPPEWVSRYLIKNYDTVDPVISEGMTRMLPFNWAEIEATEDAAEMFIDFQSHGLGMGGYSIPLADKFGRKALFSINSHSGIDLWQESIDRYSSDWVELAYVIHKKAINELGIEDDSTPTLSPRELETLHWTALGKDYKHIADILGVSEHTIRTYTRSLRYKLDCSTLAQAVAKAVQLRLINP